MSGSPRAVRLLVFWLLVVASVPAVLVLGGQLGLVEPRLALPAFAGAVLAALLGFFVFERPAGDWRTWLGRLEARLLPPPQSDTHPAVKESSDE